MAEARSLIARNCQVTAQPASWVKVRRRYEGGDAGKSAPFTGGR